MGTDLARLANEQEPLIVDLDKAIDEELQRLAAKTYGDFLCAGALLFLPDPYSDLLELSFASQPRPYNELGPMGSRYGSLDAVRENPHGVSNSGIATVAYQDGKAYSQEPTRDIRFGDRARELREAYAINGSMMAVRIDGALGEKLGVVAVYKRDIHSPLAPEQEDTLTAQLRQDAGVLADCLQRRRQVFAERNVDRYNQLALAVLRKRARIRTKTSAMEDFGDMLKRLLPASRIVLRTYCDAGREQDCFPELTKEQADAVAAFEQFSKKKEHDERSFPGLALNRRDLNPELYDTISAAFAATGHVWCGVTVGIAEPRMVCLVSRRASSVSDHWVPNDLQLLWHACHLFREQLARCWDFDLLLSQLSRQNGNGIDGTQFELLFYILKEFFGVDQVLLAQVKKTPESYEINGTLTHGFGAHNCTMGSRPKQFVPRAGCPSQPDIMVRILDDFLHNRELPIYSAMVGHASSDFTLDDELNRACDLKGQIYFLPCCLPGEKGISRLKAILHLGRHDGELEIPLAVLPFLGTLGAHVAQWLEREHRRNVLQRVRQIRNVYRFEWDQLQQICQLVADACRSLGCTLFLNVRYLCLLDGRFSKGESLKLLLERFFQASHAWDRFFADRASGLYGMLAAFLGVSDASARQLVHSSHASSLSRLIEGFLYVRVAQSNLEPELRELLFLVENHEDLPDEQVVARLGFFLFNNVYLSGYGLTGWVARYRCPILLADKSTDAIERFYRRAVESQSVLPPSLYPILDGLRLYEMCSTLQSNPVQPPKHADHISEDLNRRDPNDTYLAYPLEDIELLGQPSGIIRISNSASLRQTFDTLDEETVASAARHVSSLLRRDFMAQESRINEILAERGDEEEFYHCITRLNEQIVAIKQILAANADCTEPDGRGDLEVIISRLTEICDTALGTPQLHVLAMKIQNLGEPLTPAHLCNFIGQWLDCVRALAQVQTVGNPETLPQVPARVALWLCRLTEEMVKNQRRHQHLEQIAVVLKTDGNIRVEIGPLWLATQQTENLKWQPYSRLFEKSAEGGGARLLRKSAGLATVEFALGKNSNADEEQMIVRIVPIVGGES